MVVELDGTRFLTVDEVCSRLGIKPATLYAYVSRGVLQSYKQGIKRQRLYREDEVTTLLELRPGPAGSPARPAAEPHLPQASRRHPEDRLPPAADWIGEL